MINAWTIFWSRVDEWEQAGRPMASDTYEVTPAPIADGARVRVTHGGLTGAIGYVVNARWRNPVVRFEFPDGAQDVALAREWLERVD